GWAGVNLRMLEDLAGHLKMPALLPQYGQSGLVWISRVTSQVELLAGLKSSMPPIQETLGGPFGIIRRVVVLLPLLPSGRAGERRPFTSMGCPSPRSFLAERGRRL